MGARLIEGENPCSRGGVDGQQVTLEGRMLPISSRRRARAFGAAARHVIDRDPFKNDREDRAGLHLAATAGNLVERPRSAGLVYSYVIDNDDSRRAMVHKMIGGRPDMVARTFRDRGAFLEEVEGLEEGCVIFFDQDEESREDAVSAFIRDLNRHQRFACIMLETERNIRTAIEAMKAGAVDCLLFPCTGEEIMASIDEALEQVREVSRRNAMFVEAREQIGRLTSREQDVLHGLMHGKSNKMIALDLAISPRTVEIYRAHLMEKLGTHSLSETLKIAFAAGLS